MQKLRCDFTGVESDWYETNIMPAGWSTLTIMVKGTYPRVELAMSPDFAKKLYEKWSKLDTTQMKPTLAEIIEQSICDIAHDAAQDAVANQ